MTLAGYGYLVQMIVQVAKTVLWFAKGEHVNKALALVSAWGIVHFAGVDVATALNMRALEILNTVLIAGASMGTHDVIHLIKSLRR